RSATAARIDYLGAPVLSGMATGLVLATSCGSALGVDLAGDHRPDRRHRHTRRARGPGRAPRAARLLPPSMYTSRTVILASSTIGFVANAAMFSVLVHLPTYLQTVDGVSATLSGVHMLPLALGLVVSQSLPDVGPHTSRGSASSSPSACSSTPRGLPLLPTLGAGVRTGAPSASVGAGPVLPSPAQWLTQLEFTADLRIGAKPRQLIPSPLVSPYRSEHGGPPLCGTAS
ncbi:hypothetical protein ACWFRP_46465, partial [Streptomyces sp. NPDC055134]